MTMAPCAAAASVASGSSVTTMTCATDGHADAAATVSAAKARAMTGRSSPTASVSRVLACSGRLTGITADQAASGIVGHNVTGFHGTSRRGSDCRVRRLTVRGSVMATRQRLGAAYGFIVGVLRPLLMVFTKRDWRGAEQLPPQGTGVVIVANHVSHTDFMTAAHYLLDHGRIPRFLGKASLFHLPLLGRLIRACGQIPVYRGSHQASDAYRDAVAAIEAGECVVIYPEGTITKDPQMWPMQGKTGAARVALATGCPVLPLAQWGPNELLPPYSARPRLLPRKVMRITLGASIDLTEFEDGPPTAETARAATVQIMHALTDTLAVIRDEEPPARGESPAPDSDPKEQS